MKREEYALKYFKEQEDYVNDRVKNGVEEYRKGWSKISIVNKDGKPANAEIKITQKRHAFKYGANCFMLGELESDEKNEIYKNNFAQSFNIATLPFYWKDNEPEEGKVRYDKNSPHIYRRPAPDLCLKFCKENNIEPKAHCLNYVHNTPVWVPDDCGLMRKYLEKRFAQLSERYSGDIPNWEVINETICGCDGWKFYYEPDLVKWSFCLAEKYFPNNELTINEASHIWYKYLGTRMPYYMLIERELQSGTRIDSIGMQFHQFYKREAEEEHTKALSNPENIYKILDLYNNFNKPIQITEVTIPAYSDDSEDEEVQAKIIENLYKIWFSSKNVEAVIYWNMIDGYAAFAETGDMTAGENYYYGGLLRHDGTKKPAYSVIKNLFEKEWRTNEKVSTKNGTAWFKGFYGEYDLEITGEGIRKTVQIEISRNDSNEFVIKL